MNLILSYNLIQQNEKLGTLFPKFEIAPRVKWFAQSVTQINEK